MSGSAIDQFTSAAEYEASLRILRAVLTPVRPGAFVANSIRIDLPEVRLTRTREAAERVAFLSFPKSWRYSIFLTQPGPPLLWNGEEVHFGNIMLPGCGERLHQRTVEATNIGVIALLDTTFQHYANTLNSEALVIPREGQIVRLQSADARRLQRLHAKIGRLAETRPNTIGHHEVARAIEQELIETLFGCFQNGQMRPATPSMRSASRALTRLEDLLAADTDLRLGTRDLCAALDVPEQLLRSDCAASLGMSPNRYVRLRQARAEREETPEAGPGAGPRLAPRRKGRSHL